MSNRFVGKSIQAFQRTDTNKFLQNIIAVTPLLSSEGSCGNKQKNLSVRLYINYIFRQAIRTVKT